MADQNRSTVVGVFERRDQAQCAVEGLRRAGFSNDQIGVAMRNEEGMAPNVQDTKAGEGAVAGAVTGGILGGLLGAAVSLLVPGLGPVLAAGVLATTLAGAAGGAVAGGLAGALIGMGVPEEDARYFDREFQSGRVIVTARADNRYDEVYDILHGCGAYDMQTRPQQIKRGVETKARARQAMEEYASLEGNPPNPPAPQSYEGNPPTPPVSQSYEGHDPSEETVAGRQDMNTMGREPERLYGTAPEPEEHPNTAYGTEPDLRPSDTVYGTAPSQERSETVYGTEAPVDEEQQTESGDTEAPVVVEQVIIERRLEIMIQDEPDEEDDETS